MKTPVSPKVTASAVAGIIAAAVLANINLITPDLFTGLGKWSGLVYGLVITLAVTTAGWLKSDPLRSTSASTAPDVTIPGSVPSGDVPVPDPANPAPTAL